MSGVPVRIGEILKIHPLTIRLLQQCMHATFGVLSDHDDGACVGEHANVSCLGMDSPAGS